MSTYDEREPDYEEEMLATRDEEAEMEAMEDRYERQMEGP